MKEIFYLYDNYNTLYTCEHVSSKYLKIIAAYYVDENKIDNNLNVKYEYLKLVLYKRFSTMKEFKNYLLLERL